MIGAVLTALSTTSVAAPFVRTERIDLISEDPGTFVFEDLPRTAYTPRSTVLRWLEQVRFVATVPRYGLVFGASVASQSVSHRFRVLPDAPVYGSVGVSTKLFLPRGVLLGAETWAGPVRLGIGLHVHTDATWSRLDYTRWHAQPGIGIGLGRRPDGPRKPRSQGA